MGGRLSFSNNNRIQCFPVLTWEKEFEQASRCGFELIEWVFDVNENPILDREKSNKIKLLSEKNNVRINSICADYFMQKMLFNESPYSLSKNLEVLKKLIHKCNELQIKIIEIPLVDSSSLKTLSDKSQLVHNIKKMLPLAEENNVIINLETDLPPNQFKELIDEFDSKNLRANYDIGNSISLGYDIENELTVLRGLITNIHIKDRKTHGTTVPLGTGNVDFDLFFQTIKKINYVGDFIIQGARENETIVSPEETCMKYLRFVKHYIDKYLL